MAVLAARTWAQLLTEALLRVGNITTSGFDARMQRWLEAAYFNLCTTYHHVEFDTISTSLTASTTSNEVDLSSLSPKLFVLAGLRLRASSTTTSTITGPLVPRDFRSVFDKYTATAGQPTTVARWGDKLYFDTLPLAAYGLNLYYLRYPTAPDFAAPTSPETGRDVEEHIIEGAIQLAFPGMGRPDLGAVNRELVATWLNEQVRLPLTADPIVNLPERQRAGTTTVQGQG